MKASLLVPVSVRTAAATAALVALAVGLIFLSSGCDGEDEEVGPEATTLTPTSVTASPTQSSSPSSTPSGSPDEQGTLVIAPSSGPIGTTVQISGSGCSYPGQETILSFEGGQDSSGTWGGVELPRIPTTSLGEFATEFIIPEELGTLQGSGGGPVIPGTYRFASHPPFCYAGFRVE